MKRLILLAILFCSCGSQGTNNPEQPVDSQQEEVEHESSTEIGKDVYVKSKSPQEYDSEDLHNLVDTGDIMEDIKNPSKEVEEDL
jgi:hypothetical protein